MSRLQLMALASTSESPGLAFCRACMQYASTLDALGVETWEDVGSLDVNELVAAGVKLVYATQLLRTATTNLATSSALDLRSSTPPATPLLAVGTKRSSQASPKVKRARMEPPTDETWRTMLSEATVSRSKELRNLAETYKKSKDSEVLRCVSLVTWDFLGCNITGVLEGVGLCRTSRPDRPFSR